MDHIFFLSQVIPTHVYSFHYILSLEFEWQHIHGIRGNSQRLGDTGVVAGLEISPDTVCLGSDCDQTVLVLDIPHLVNTTKAACKVRTSSVLAQQDLQFKTCPFQQ